MKETDADAQAAGEPVPGGPVVGDAAVAGEPGCAAGESECAGHDAERAAGDVERRRSGSVGRVRKAVKLGVFALIVVGLGVHTGWGTYSSMGIDFVATICPLGAVESLAGSWSFVPRLVIALAVMCAIVLVVGRAFCSWVCPVPSLSAFFCSKKTRARIVRAQTQAAQASLERAERAALPAGDGDGDAPDAQLAPARPRLDSRHAVLAAAAGSAAVFGFPVFCLICPIGLTCAALVLLMRLVTVGELSWGLLAFPLVVVLEVVFLRDFCGKFCPVSALMSLIARGNRTFRPRADREACLRRTEGRSCHTCASVCPQHIDPHSDLGDVSSVECTRCGRCVDACPVKAVHLRLKG